MVFQVLACLACSCWRVGVRQDEQDFFRIYKIYPVNPVLILFILSKLAWQAGTHWVLFPSLAGTAA